MICFGLLSESTYDKRVEDLANNIGMLAYMAGTRPSTLFDWDDEEEWVERLIFDLQVAV